MWKAIRLLAACSGIAACGHEEPDLELRVVSVELDAEVTGDDAGLAPGRYWAGVVIELENRGDAQAPLGFAWFRLVADTGVSYLASPLTALEEDACAADAYVVGGASASCRLVFALEEDELPDSLTYHDDAGGVRAEAAVQLCPGEHLCGRQCVDLRSDPNNCGRCGRQVAGECVVGENACGPGLTACDDACIDLATDNENCGACGSPVASGRTCVGGVGQCVAPLSECSGQCVDLTTDLANCGACGVAVLPEITTCRDGEVGCLDPAHSICDGACVDLATDPANCGECGNPVVLDITTCTDGEVTCFDAAESICGDTCVDLQRDVDNCGACGHRCPAADFGSDPKCEASSSTCSTTRPNPGGTCDALCESNGWECRYESGFCTCAGDYAPGQCECQCRAPVIPEG